MSREEIALNHIAQLLTSFTAPQLAELLSGASNDLPSYLDIFNCRSIPKYVESCQHAPTKRRTCDVKDITSKLCLSFQGKGRYSRKFKQTAFKDGFFFVKIDGTNSFEARDITDEPRVNYTGSNYSVARILGRDWLFIGKGASLTNVKARTFDGAGVVVTIRGEHQPFGSTHFLAVLVVTDRMDDDQLSSIWRNDECIDMVKSLRKFCLNGKRAQYCRLPSVGGSPMWTILRLSSDTMCQLGVIKPPPGASTREDIGYSVEDPPSSGVIVRVGDKHIAISMPDSHSNKNELASKFVKCTKHSTTPNEVELVYYTDTGSFTLKIESEDPIDPAVNVIGPLLCDDIVMVELTGLLNDHEVRILLAITPYNP